MGKVICHIENGHGDDILVHRFYGACDIEGNLYRVKTTMLEFRDETRTNRPHSYEVTKIELLDGLSNSPRREMVGSNPSISAAKLLNNVEKSYDFGKNLLEESKKEPPPFCPTTWHQSPEHQQRQQLMTGRTTCKGRNLCPQLLSEEWSVGFTTAGNASLPPYAQVAWFSSASQPDRQEITRRIIELLSGQTHSENISMSQPDSPEDWRAVFQVIIGIFLRPSQTCKCTREYLFRTLQ